MYDSTNSWTEDVGSAHRSSGTAPMLPWPKGSKGLFSERHDAMEVRFSFLRPRALSQLAASRLAAAESLVAIMPLRSCLQPEKPT